MKLSQVKLVVSDMDGTLLNNQGKVSQDFFKLFEALKKENIHFVAASGRQYYSITDKLNGITNDITIIAENGAITKQQDKDLLLINLSKEEIKDLVLLLRPFEDIEIVLCGKKSAYILSADYKGFTSGSAGSGSGILIWSGSVLDKITDDYSAGGVGMELVSDSSSYFRFRT
ncbi:MAG TPA: HAD-IIB family hydrolase, partial [Flavobacteriaceae bacterium]|nr:HAD-IIB family hydrolase [Flavobacteriaceae bacterium]